MIVSQNEITNNKLILLNGVFKAVNVGAIVFDSEQRVVLWNRWMERHSHLAAEEVVGKNFSELFPALIGKRIHSAIDQALRNSFPSLLSQTLNKAPFALYTTAKEAANDILMHQAVEVIPIEVAELPRHCLVQVMDVSLAVTREKLLREQALVLRSQTFADGLTGIANRRSFDETMEKEYRRAKRTPSPLSLIMIDIDYFKPYNDLYGHQRGDQCLIDVAAALTEVLQRPSDLVARYGGEEFAIILPETNAEGAVKIGEALRSKIEKLGIEHGYSNTSKYVTVSVGVATQIPEPQTEISELIGAADRALYDAKRAGRNRIVLQMTL